MSAILLESHLEGIPLLHRGKVRDTYDLGESLLIVASDRVSAFDVVMKNGIPGKGKILTQMSNFWFRQMESVCENHLLVTSDSDIAKQVPDWHSDLLGRSVIVKKAQPLTIECVARGYITGSLYKEYLANGPDVHGLNLPPGLLDGDRLPEPIFTPATKEQTGHDENISFEEACKRVGEEVAHKVRELTLEIFRLASSLADRQGLILADTKVEFGLFQGEIIWIDEALTPDSSRFWDKSTWMPGRPLPGFDKQFIRNYLETIGWDKKPPGPTLPKDVVSRTLELYTACFNKITGQQI